MTEIPKLEQIDFRPRMDEETLNQIRAIINMPENIGKSFGLEVSPTVKTILGENIIIDGINIKLSIGDYCSMNKTENGYSFNGFIIVL